LPLALQQYNGGGTAAAAAAASDASLVSGVPTSSLQYDGVEDSIALLRAWAEDRGTLFEFAEWLLLRAPARAMAIFTAPTRGDPGGDPPADAVLEFLRGQRFAEAARRNPAASVSRLFLEHLVHGQGRREERYHTGLALEYLDAVTHLRGGGGGASQQQQQRDALAAAMATTSRDRPWPGTEGGMLGDLRAKLVRLLQDSGAVDALALQARLRGSTLYEERIILHARRGEHPQALALLVGTLADHGQAVRYCALLSGPRAGSGGRGGSAAAVDSRSAGVLSTDGDGYLSPPRAAAASNSGDASGSSDAASSTEPFTVLLRLYLEADAGERARRATLTLPLRSPRTFPRCAASYVASSRWVATFCSCRASSTS